MRLFLVLTATVVLAGCDIHPIYDDEEPRAPATYAVTFDATWSAETHPADFPMSAHFSPLVGATHADDVSLWEIGDIASDGVRSMAETGSTSQLRAEVEALGTSATVVQGDGLGVSPGVATATMTVTDAQPLATLVTMIAPSPDWFVGVSGLDLREGDGWAELVVVDLVVYDAGTDDGASYTAENDTRTERAPIAASPYAPLTGTTVGTLTFTRTD